MSMDKVIYTLAALQVFAFAYYKFKIGKLNKKNEKLQHEVIKKDQLIRDQSYVIKQDNKARTNQSNVNKLSDNDIERMFNDNKWSD